MSIKTYRVDQDLMKLVFFLSLSLSSVSVSPLHANVPVSGYLFPVVALAAAGSLPS